MSIPTREQRILQQKSGNVCAFEDCRRVLTVEMEPGSPDVLLGEMAHIVAESPDGERGGDPLPLDQRNLHSNLILLCNNHHQIIDDPGNAAYYTVERLRGIKEKHERWVQQTLNRAHGTASVLPQPKQVTETLFSNLLRVEQMPLYVYGIPCATTNEREVSASLQPLRDVTTSLGDEKEMAPFIIRGGMLYAFQNLNDGANPFRDMVAGQSAERISVDEWWDDPDRMRWYVDLLNRALNKLTGRRHLQFDREHRRYYFQPDEPGDEMIRRYRSVNGKWSKRKVVWEPQKRSTGEGRGYWLHRAVSLRFMRFDGEHWFVSVRPELRATADGHEALPSEKIGSKVNRKMTRRFNHDLMAEVHFWRDYLGDSKPRIIMPFGPKQRIIISTTPMHGDVVWPGIPEEHVKLFTNAEFLDDLFTWAEINALQDEDGSDWDNDEEFEYEDDEEEADDEE